MKKTKIFIDSLLLVVTILLTDIDISGRLTHEILGKLAIIVMFIHIGMHLDRMFIKIKSKKIKEFLYCIYIIMAGLVSIYSIYTLTHSYQLMYMFGTKQW